MQPNEPGEFTRMFQTPLHQGGSPLDAPPPPQQPALGGGEYTRMFENAQYTPPPPSRQPQAPPPPPYGQEGPGEFTKMFGRSSLGGSPSEPFHPGTPAASEATRVFEIPGNAQAPEAAPPAQEGPGEYTRMFGAPVAPSAPPPPPKAATKPAQAKGKQKTPDPKKAATSYTALFIVLGVVVILVIALILFFVFQK